MPISLDNQKARKEGSRFRILNNSDTHKEDYKGDLPDSRHYKEKEAMYGNFLENNTAPHFNGCIEKEKIINNSNLK